MSGRQFRKALSKEEEKNALQESIPKSTRYATKWAVKISRYGAGIEHLRQHFFRSSYPCQLVTRLRCVYRGARMLTGNTCKTRKKLV